MMVSIKKLIFYLSTRISFFPGREGEGDNLEFTKWKPKVLDLDSLCTAQRKGPMRSRF